MSKKFRTKYPKIYKIYQEIVGDIYYEIIGLGAVIRYFSKKRFRRIENSSEDIIDIPFDFKGIGPYKTIRPFQIKSEIKGFFNLVKDFNPKVTCEIGSDMGGTFYLWSRAMQKEGLLISMDLPRLYRKSLNRFFSSIINSSITTKYVRQNTHSTECVSHLKDILKDRQIDFLFIDGDHSYEGVKQDFEMYAKFVRKGGLIAFHDIVKHKMPEDVCGVDKLWDELKTEYRCVEFIDDENQDWAGIGVLHVDEPIQGY